MQNILGEHISSLSNSDVTVVISRNSTLRVFPSLLINQFENLEYLSLENAKITTFPSRITNCNQLETVIIDRSEINEIPGGIFERCQRLSSLTIKASGTMTILENAFTGLSALKRLELEDNALTTIFNENTLIPLPNLSVINLSNNKMNEIHPLLFESSANLEYVWINGNNLSSLHIATFRNTIKLKGMALGNNKITNIEAGMLNRLVDLVELELSFNSLEELPIFEGIEKLAFLDVDNNQIKTILPNTFEKLPNLESLRLTNNLIEKLEAGTFSNQKKLRRLSVNHNQLSNLEADVFASLEVLEVLDLSNNRLSRLNGNAFAGLSSLIRLFANTNQIERVEQKVFENMPKLQILELLDNVCTDEIFQVGNNVGSDYPMSRQCYSFASKNQISIVLLMVAVLTIFFK